MPSSSHTILIAGFQHETNTFAPSKATYENFEHGGAYPSMSRGTDLLALREVNIPTGGFIRVAEAAGHTLVPIIWAGACPSAHVTRDAFECIAGEIVEAARTFNFDAVYLDLHGAMVAEHVDDGEGELLARVREAVGSNMPIVASLDLHANVTERMLRNADALVAYRTYPHVDMADTGARAAALLGRLLAGQTLHGASRRLPFLIPINAMCTLFQPSRGVYDAVTVAEAGAVVSVSFAPGFPAADFAECGPVIWAYAHSADAAHAAVDSLYSRILADEPAWCVPLLSPDEAVREAMRLAEDAGRPVVIADTQDNPGAGGDANTMEMLRALVRNGATGAAFGLVYDPAAAAAAHRAGVGARLELSLGGQSNVPSDAPFAGVFEVVSLSDGKCRYDGPMMNGMQAELGPVACLRFGGVFIAVSSAKVQMLDRNLYRVAGIQPEDMKILVNKSSVHFRADFEPIAKAVLVAKAPGPMVADPADLPWTRLARGMRVRPCGEAFGSPPADL
ncbi:M81 family metallopeptidase [Burkholderia ubonensis]|uniref:M81 family metallopeptidase n=1 Tax=Burkholderia ubonensis TaxID=101571 RepID=UPI00075B2624|nr:M81 family metallopeptidase [Burkholderia ubonensis]KVD42734.1 microcystin degradation protein MlrC [Burkholderia ubonensis]KVR74422.1 microcystin degradation protein MlrC [Burkholderia ubonensis]KVT04953.1 microcystin degradation protein MlrC [Burkholderia ubonensis]KVT14924.1 microcystin degradation protein MlrC [Burkholderia ubonensis]KVT36706.1 microcystin degradation protein MlrC [Burkholderia ubonensis]